MTSHNDELSDQMKSRTQRVGSSWIRRAERADAARLHAIAKAAYAKYIERIGREPAPMRTDYAAEIAAGRALVIEDCGSVAGFVICRPHCGAYHIENVAVDPLCQGKGLGRQLIERAIDTARVAELSVVRLYTNAAMAENVAMYLHLGFVETHRAIDDGYHRVFMELKLP